MPADGWHVSAGEIETLVIKRLASWLADAASVVGHLEGQNRIDALVAAAAKLGAYIPVLPSPVFRQLLLDIDTRLGIRKDRMPIPFRQSGLINKLGGKGETDDSRSLAVRRLIRVFISVNFDNIKRQAIVLRHRANCQDASR